MSATSDKQKRAFTETFSKSKALAGLSSMSLKDFAMKFKKRKRNA